MPQTTIYAARHRCAADRDATRDPAIGHPVVNNEAFVLNRFGQLAPQGVPGELVMGGAGLARGYLARPALTARRFVPHPFGGSGERLYRTGDLVRRREDGSLEFLGRIDAQVKLRGLRIELGEVEAALRELPGIEDTAATVLPDAGGGPSLIAAPGREQPGGQSPSESVSRPAGGTDSPFTIRTSSSVTVPRATFTRFSTVS